MDPPVLRLQADHRSSDVGGGGPDDVLFTRVHLYSLTRDWIVDERMIPYIRRAGFFCVHRLRAGVFLDRALITALVERWRQETHTFHLPVGEATITLQDVAVLLGLRVDGGPITGPTAFVWSDLVLELLGVDVTTVDSEPLQGASLRLSWLRERFSHIPADCDELTVQYYSRAYILYLLGAILFADKSGDTVQLVYLPLLRDFDSAGALSWGSATLAFMYRHLCRASRRGVRQIGGPLILLQLWSWEHIVVGRPDVHRLRHPSPFDPDAPPYLLGEQHQAGVDPLGTR